MELRSLGFRSDLIFARFDGEVIDHHDHVAVRTPANPAFYWGNFLLFARAPGPGDEQGWPALFAREIGTPPTIGHVAYGWDSPEGETGSSDAFLRAGYQPVRWSVQTSSRPVAPARPASGVAIRRFASDQDWAQSVENQVASREPGYDADPYRRFAAARVPRYRAMIAAGLGDWWGAFCDDGTLAADLGLFSEGPLARYQSVQTRPELQRRGIAGTLVHAAAAHAIEHRGVEQLVIVSEAGTAVERLYATLGFAPTELQVGLIKRP